jgi:hypothetical protein
MVDVASGSDHKMIYVDSTTHSQTEYTAPSRRFLTGSCV